MVAEPRTSRCPGFTPTKFTLVEIVQYDSFRALGFAHTSAQANTIARVVMSLGQTGTSCYRMDQSCTLVQVTRLGIRRMIGFEAG
jgi:hypothetical protein